MEAILGLLSNLLAPAISIILQGLCRQRRGLLVAGEPLLEVSASHFSAQDLYKALHTNELTRRDETVFNLDLMQCGLGGNSCGPKTLDKYLVWPGPARFSLLFRPFSQGALLGKLGREWMEKI